MREPVGLIILLGGSSRRFAGSIPKQYIKIEHTPIWISGLKQILAAQPMTDVAVVTSGEGRQMALSQFTEAGLGFEPVWVDGGKERQDSVLSGLEALESRGIRYVLVHDGARPNPGVNCVQQLIHVALESQTGAILGCPLTDTIKRADVQSLVVDEPDRMGLFRVQTPQMFPFKELLQAYQKYIGSPSGTDDAWFFRRAGGQVRIVLGQESNLKVTYPQDIDLARYYLRVQA